MILGGGRTFLDGFRDEITLQQKALICMYDNNDVFHFSLVKDALFSLALKPCYCLSHYYSSLHFNE
jgi:hypothetical protein